MISAVAFFFDMVYNIIGSAVRVFGTADIMYLMEVTL